MKTHRKLIVANNAPYKWEQIIADLKRFYVHNIAYEVDVVNTSYSYIPTQEAQSSDGGPVRIVNTVWFDTFIAPLGKNYDSITFILNPLTITEPVQLGYMVSGTPFKTTVCANDTDRIFINGKDLGLSISMAIIHEDAHGHAHVLNVPDRTHEYFYSGQPEKVLEYIIYPDDIPEPIYKPTLRLLIEKLKVFIPGFRSYVEKQQVTQHVCTDACFTKEVVEPPKPVEKGALERWAEAIKKHEGWFVGSRSYRNHNPGNFKYTSYTKSLGATGKDRGDFCIFKNYEAGWNALLQFLKDAQNNKLIYYKGHMTLGRFFEVYAPRSDNNDSRRYAEVVAKAIGVSVDTRIDQIR